MPNNNNKLPPHALTLTLLLLIPTLAASTPHTQSHSTQLQDLPILTLHRNEQTYLLPLTINHHSLKLTAQLHSGRTWIKEALCNLCDITTEQCKQSCFSEKDAVRISCDSSFCSEVGDYIDQPNGFSGKEVELFLKVGDSSQVLMPLVLATKLYHSHVEIGEYFLFDQENSFSSAILTRAPQGNLQLHNLQKIEADDVGKYRQAEGKPLNMTMSAEQFDFSFLNNKGVILHHVSNTTYANFTDETQYELAFSLQALPVVFPVKLAKKVEKYLNEVYLPGKKCKLLPKKLKCSSAIDMGQVFRTVFHFHLNEYVLPIPFHLLVTGCSSNECTTLISFDDSSQNTITFGTVIWQLYNLEYSLKGKYVIFHRRISQFDDLLLVDKIQLSQASFGYKLLLIVYHTFRYLLIALFWLAVFSIIINAIIKWRSILAWFRDILIRRKQRRSKVSQRQEQEIYEEKPLRKISKLPDPFEDSEHL